MQIIPSISELRRTLGHYRLDGKSIGVVPTMGALHDGHVSLIKAARSSCDVVVMTLFVNPTQFNDKGDLAKYPRDLESDSSIAESAGADYIFAPGANEIYPDGFSTSVTVSDLADILEGASRPGHFNGVVTVVAKLLNIVQADRAFFGLKDYQQLQIVKRLTLDLDIATEIVSCPTIREADGLAMSSRNVRLTPDQRKAAGILSQALFAVRDLAASGVVDCAQLSEKMANLIKSERLAKLDYAIIAHPGTLKPIDIIDPEVGAVALIAAKFGDVRLIDNMLL